MKINLLGGKKNNEGNMIDLFNWTNLFATSFYGSKDLQKLTCPCTKGFRPKSQIHQG